MSQSLLHQVTYSDSASVTEKSRLGCLNPFYIRSRIPTSISLSLSLCPAKSQSLLHQVTYSDSRQPQRISGQCMCLNPFYIRSRIPTKPVIFSVQQSTCLNPFYIRSRIPTAGRGRSGEGNTNVSIPFTSGHVFRQQKKKKKNRGSYGCLNPFYIRSRIPTKSDQRSDHPAELSQSLLHQVTYSDTCVEYADGESEAVSQSLLHQVTYSDLSN